MNKRKRKVIFLDVDGVLNDFYTSVTIPGLNITGVDDEKINLLKKITEEVPADIILSSSWRQGNRKNTGKPLKYLLRKLGQAGLVLAGETPQEKHWADRGAEIAGWLSLYGADEWVVLDDEYFKDYMDYGIAKHLVHTSVLCGLTSENVRQAVQILNGRLNSLSEEEIAQAAWARDWENIRIMRQEGENSCQQTEK